jgi:hypothetical protein
MSGLISRVWVCPGFGTNLQHGGQSRGTNYGIVNGPGRPDCRRRDKSDPPSLVPRPFEEEEKWFPPKIHLVRSGLVHAIKSVMGYSI